MFTNAKENLSVDDDWTLAQTLFGVTTYYRREVDESLSIKIEGELHGIPLFEQMAVLRECDLYHTWAPFMQKSRKLAQLDKLDVVAWYIVGAPLLGLTRDACYRAVGCDCMKEDGSVLLVAVGLNDSLEYGVKETLNGNGMSDVDDNDTRSDSGVMQQQKPEPISRHTHSDGYINEQKQRQKNYHAMDSSLVDTSASSFLTRDAILETIEIPPIPQGLGRGRMTLRNFSACVEILGPSSARTKMVVNVDPNLTFIPQSLIDFCMKRMCGVLLSRLQATARKVVKDPIKNPHSRRMREDVRFYRDWLLPKFRRHCEELDWTMPAVGALSVSEEDLKAEGIFEGWRANYETTTVPMQQYCEDEKSASIVSSPSIRRRASGSSSSSTGSQSSRFGRLGNMFHDRELQASIKRELKIASARERAAERLQPKPFSESKAVRLKELKIAKLRAEQRNQTKGLGTSSMSISSHSTFRDVDAEGALERDVKILFSTFLFNVALMPLRPYAISSVALSSPRISFLNLMGIIAPNFLAFFIMALQAVTLWALINSTLVFAFESIDFGQKKLVKNLEFGKKLYIDSIKTYSTITSIYIVALSTGFAFMEYMFRRSVRNTCTFISGGIATFSGCLDAVLQADSSASKALLYCAGAIGKAFCTVLKCVHYVTFNISIATPSRYARALVSWVGSKLAFIIPAPLKMIASSASKFIYEMLMNLFSSRLSFCDAGTNIVSWRQRALEMTNFVNTRIGVFILALLLMAHLLLPKPEKKLRKFNVVSNHDVQRTDAHGSNSFRLVESDTGASSLVDARGLSGSYSAGMTRSMNVSSMDVISEEETIQ